jgi:phosphonoacetaldehyde hydrolase
MKRNWRLPSAPYTLQGVIFDWAGTTVDYGCQAPPRAFVAAFARHGVELSLAEARAPMGLAKKDHVRVLLAMEAVRARWRAAHGEDPGIQAAAVVYADVEPMLLENVRQHTQLIPGVADLAEQLRGLGIRIGSTTGYTARIMEELAPAAERQGFRPDALFARGRSPKAGQLPSCATSMPCVWGFGRCEP